MSINTQGVIILGYYVVDERSIGSLAALEVCPIVSFLFSCIFLQLVLEHYVLTTILMLKNGSSGCFSWEIGHYNASIEETPRSSRKQNYSFKSRLIQEMYGKWRKGLCERCEDDFGKNECSRHECKEIAHDDFLLIFNEGREDELVAMVKPISFHFNNSSLPLTTYH